jgi:hypothetical protein
MKGKLFFIPGQHLLVYCHQEIKQAYGVELILGGMANFVEDAKGNYLRQRISQEDFSSYGPLILEESRMGEYPFITKDQMLRGMSNKDRYRVTQVEQHPKNMKGYLKKAERMDDEVIIKLFGN